MPVDPNVFNNIKSFQDYNMANQDFLARQQAANIANQQQSSVLKGQTLYAAASTGDPAIWQSALQKLNANGIDTSDVPEDVAQGAKYAEGLRQAQSPLGTLLNAASKLDSNTNAAAIAGGSIPSNPNAIATSVLAGKALTNAVQPATAPQAVTPNQAMSSPPSAFMQTMTAPTSEPIKANTPAAAAATMDLFGQPANITTVAPVAQSSAVPVKSAVNFPAFSPPANDPQKTQAANQAAYQQALETYKSSPDYIQASAAAGDTGKEGVKLQTGANASQEIFDKLNQNLDALSALNPKVPTQGMVLSPETQGRISTGLATDGLGSGAAGDALNQWNQINHQQILNGLQQLVQSGAIRSNKTIAEMLKTGSGIDASGGTVAGRQAMIDNLRTELKNATVAAQNQSSAVNGGIPQSYSALPQSNVNSPLSIQNAAPTQAASLPIISSPNDPKFKLVQSGDQFVGSDGIVRTKH